MPEKAVDKAVEEQDAAKMTEPLDNNNSHQKHQQIEEEKTQDSPGESTAAITSNEKSAQEKEAEPLVSSTAATDQTAPIIVAETAAKKQKLSDASASSNPALAVKKPTEGASSQQALKQTPQQSSTHTPPPPPQTPQTQSNQHSFDLEDYSIIPQTVRDLLTLLQLYGALTAGQLEYNLPVNNSPSLIQDVLEVLVCIGLVQKVQEEDESKTPRYCVNRGVPRADAVNLPVLQHEILAAHRQANRSFERTKLLQTALQDDNSNPKEILQKILHDYPEIQQDPVYMTALRQCHVDASTSSSTGEKVRKRSVTSTTPKQRKSTLSTKAELKVGTKNATNKSPPSTVSKNTAETKPSTSSVPEAINKETVQITSQATSALSDGLTQS